MHRAACSGARVLAIASSMAMSTVVGVARAEPNADDLARASAHFQEGKKAFGAKRYVEAARAFDAAYAIVPDAGTAFNGALAWESAHEPARAADDYTRVTRSSGLDAASASDANRALARLEASLTRVEVRTSAPARVAVAYRDEAAPVVVHLAVGTHAAVVTFDHGARATRSIDVAREPIVVDVDLPSPEAPAARAIPTPSSSPRAAHEVPAKETGRVRRILGFVSLGLGVTGGATAVGLGLAGLHARDTFEASHRDDASARDRAVLLRSGTNVAWAFAGAFAVTGIVLVATSFDAPAKPAVSLAIRPDALTFSTSF